MPRPREKIVRDPVHDLIVLRVDDPAERLLFDLMNAEEFQRLRRVRQLGLASLAYPAADHSRYSHSLGVMATARLMLDRLAQHVDVDSADRTLVLVAALLHDLGHGPFSHVFERVTGVHHERLGARVVLDPTSRVHQLLIQHDATLPEKVVALLAGRHRRPFLAQIISSQLDADRLDYLLRDNLTTGSRYGRFDLQWLVQALVVAPGSERLAIAPKAVSAVEAYLQARYHMYRNVYFHKVVRSAEGMLKLALKRARRLAVQERLPWPARESGAMTALLGGRLTMRQFVGLDDVSLLMCFKAWADGPDATLAKLCRGLLFRQLYKTINLPADAPPDVADRAAEAVKDAGGDPEYDVFYDEAVDAPHGAKPEKAIPVLDRGELVDLARASPLAEALTRPLAFRRVHVVAEHRAAVERALA